MTAPRPAIPLDQLVQMLADRVVALCQRLLPAGHREGAEWIEARRKDGGLGDSMRVHLVGARAGVWKHFAADRAGDALDLVAYLATNGDKKAAVKWARAWLGLDQADPLTLERARAEAAANAAAAQRADRAERERKRRAAFALFVGAQSSLKGTPADLYLKARGLDLGRLGRQPRALRFHPALKYIEWDKATGEVKLEERFPALIAAVNSPEGPQLTVHRTWLEHYDGAWRKARVAEPKKTFGPYAGGLIPIWRGASGKSLREAPAGSELFITEGIEDALTVAIACPLHRVVAAVSLGNLAAIHLPAQIERVTIVAQNDKEPEAIAALDRAVRRFLADRRRVFVAKPPAEVKDVNDLIRGGAAA